MQFAMLSAHGVFVLPCPGVHHEDDLGHFHGRAIPLAGHLLAGCSNQVEKSRMAKFVTKLLSQHRIIELSIWALAQQMQTQKTNRCCNTGIALCNGTIHVMN